MAGVKLSAKVFSNIFKYVRAEGRTVKGDKKEMFTDCLMEIQKTKVKIESMDQYQTLMISLEVPLKKGQLVSRGDIPIHLEKAIKCIKRFKPSDIVTLSYDEDKNKMIFRRTKPSLKLKRNTVATDSVESSMEKGIPFVFDGKLNVWKGANSEHVFDTYIKLDANELNEVVEDGEQIQHRNFPFTVTKKKVKAVPLRLFTMTCLLS